MHVDPEIRILACALCCDLKPRARMHAGGPVGRAGPYAYKLARMYMCMHMLQLCA